MNKYIYLIYNIYNSKKNHYLLKFVLFIFEEIDLFYDESYLSDLLKIFFIFLFLKG